MSSKSESQQCVSGLLIYISEGQVHARMLAKALAGSMYFVGGQRGVDRKHPQVTLKEPTLNDRNLQIILDIKLALGRCQVRLDCSDWPAIASVAGLKDPGTRSEVMRLIVNAVFPRLKVQQVDVVLKEPTQTQAEPSASSLWINEKRIEIYGVDASLHDRMKKRLMKRQGFRGPNTNKMTLPCNIYVGSFDCALARVKHLKVNELILLKRSPNDRINSPASIASNQTDSGAYIMIWGSQPESAISFSIKVFEKCAKVSSPLTVGNKMNKSDIKALHLEGLLSRNTTQRATHLNGRTPVSEADQESFDARRKSIGAAKLINLKIPVRFEIAGPLLDVVEVFNLEIGDVVNVELPVESALVQITVAGQLVGRGELIRLGEHLGVRIAELNELAR